MFKSSYITLLLAVLLIQFSCTHNNPVPVPGQDLYKASVSQSCDSDSVYFENQILPIFIASCAVTGCHDQATKADGISLVDYANIMRGIKPGKPNESKYFKVMTLTNSDDLMPIDPQTEEGFSLPADQIALIESWINQNSPNNSCSECDTTAYSFSGQIMPIMSTSCATSIGCHASGSDFGQFTSYDNIRPYVDNGSLMDRVVVKMDMPIAAPLPPCDITIVQRWLEEGGPNN